MGLADHLARGDIEAAKGTWCRAAGNRAVYNSGVGLPTRMLSRRSNRGLLRIRHALQSRGTDGTTPLAGGPNEGLPSSSAT